MVTASFSLYLLVIEDIPILARDSGEAILSGRQTRLKDLAEDPYDHEESSRTYLSQFFIDPGKFMKSNRLIKLVDNATGEIMGHAVTPLSEEIVSSGWFMGFGIMFRKAIRSFRNSFH